MTLPSAVTVLLILYSTKLAGIETATLTISTIPSPPVFGTTGFNVRCTYSLDADDTFRTINIMSSLKPNAKSFLTLIVIDSDGPASWSQINTPESLRNRATVMYSKTSKYIEIRFPTTKCEDINTQYFFKLTTMQESSRLTLEKSEQITIDIVARPEPPTLIVLTNAMQASCVEPGKEMTFECSANVGRPASNSDLLWYLVKEDGSVQDITDRATEKGLDLLAGEPSCTFRKHSTLKMTFDGKNYPDKTSVRCVVKHPYANYALCTNPSVHFCMKAPDMCAPGVRGIGTVNMSVTQIPDPAVLGPAGYTVRAELKLNSTTVLRSLQMVSQKSASHVVVLLGDTEANWESNNIPQLLKGRAEPFTTPDLRYLEIRVVNTTCADVNYEFMFEFSYYIKGTTAAIFLKKTRKLRVRGLPEPPEPITSTPNVGGRRFQFLQENAVVTFTCEASVGFNSPGSIEWYAATGNDYVNFTDQARKIDISIKSYDRPCTFRVRSTLTLTLTPATLGNPASIRCVSTNPARDFRACANPVLHFCQKTSPICFGGPPTAPDSMEGDSAEHDRMIYIAEKTSKQFICTANVGRVGGAILWYALSADGSLKNLTNRATQVAVSVRPEDPLCTWRVESTLTTYLSRAEFGNHVSIRCAVNCPGANVTSCASTADYCLKSKILCFGLSRVLPKPPEAMRVGETLPLFPVCAKHGTGLSFSCESNVGYPPGKILWYAVQADNTIRNITNQAEETDLPLNSQDPLCTFRKRSSVNIRLVGDEFPGNTSVRCAVSHPQNDPSFCSTPAVDFCQRSPVFCVEEQEVSSEDKPPTENKDEDDRSDLSETNANGAPKEGSRIKTTTAQSQFLPSTMSSSSTATTVVAVLGCLALVCFLAVVIFFLVQRNNSERSSAHQGVPTRRASSVSIQYGRTPGQYGYPSRKSTPGQYGYPGSSPIILTMEPSTTSTDYSDQSSEFSEV